MGGFSSDSDRPDFLLGGVARDLGTVVIAKEGDTRRDFDLRADCPGRIEVRVQVMGGSAGGLDVSLRPVGVRHGPGLRGRTDDGGVARMILFPGLYTIVVQSRSEIWMRQVLPDARIDSNGDTSRMAHIEVFEGTLAIFDGATGEPLSGQDVLISQRGPAGVAAGQTITDGAGRLRLRRPAGAFELSPVFARAPGEPYRREPRVTIEWGPSGPVPNEVRFPAE